MTGASENADFVPAERLRLASVVRYGAALAAFSLAATALNNLSVFQPSAAIAFSKWSIVLAVNLFVVIWWTKSANYPGRPLGDLIVAIPIIIWFAILRHIIITQEEVTNWSAVTTTNGNYLLGFTFASVLFPANFKSYVIWTAILLASCAWTIYSFNPTPTEASFAWSGMLPITAIILFTVWSSEKKARENFELKLLLEQEKFKSDEMLYSILPEEIATRMRAGEAVADSFADATVVFIDIAGSSALARDLSAKQFLKTLNEVFAIADEGVSRFGVEKVKTIGDAYLAVAGARTRGEASAAVKFAIYVAEEVTRLAADRSLDFSVRVGIHTGPVVGGVIGRHRATYDYWGDTMNVASRLESVAPPGGVTVSKQTYFATRDEVDYHMPRIASLKGVGDLEVFDVAM